jgi:hypothetical protein
VGGDANDRKVLIIGAGDMGGRLAAGLAASGRLREVVLVDLPGSGLGEKAATIASSFDALVRAVECDACRQREVERLLTSVRPDLVVQAASMQSPWALIGRRDASARALSAAGIGIRLPLQLPCLLSVMRAVREVDFDGPVANLSLPDLTHPILAGLGHAPTVGLGNVAMLLVRVRAALRSRQPEGELPLVRVVGQHFQVYGVMQARPPADPADRPRVYLGEQGERADALAYAAPPIAPGLRYNEVTAAAALPVLLALLPGAAPLRWSTPAPAGLPGGYPVRIVEGLVSVDLPPEVELGESAAYCARIGRSDGVERVDPDGTVHFTEEARSAIAEVAPDLGEPLPIDDRVIATRAERILELLWTNDPAYNRSR